MKLLSGFAPCLLAASGCFFTVDPAPGSRGGENQDGRDWTTKPPSSDTVNQSCEDEHDGVKLSGSHGVGDLNAHMSAKLDDQSLEVRAALSHRRGSAFSINDYVILNCGDFFSAYARKPTGERASGEIVLERAPNADPRIVEYVAKLPPTRESGEVVIAFNRGSGKGGAPLSTAPLRPFSLSLDSEYRSGTRGMVKLSNGDAPMQLTLEGECLSERVVVNYNGAFDVPHVSRECPVTVTAMHAASGSVDSAFRRGSFDSIDSFPIQHSTKAITTIRP